MTKQIITDPNTAFAEAVMRFKDEVRDRTGYSPVIYIGPANGVMPLVRLKTRGEFAGMEILVAD